MLMDEYHCDDDYEPQPPRQQSRVYQFSRDNYNRSNDNSVNDLFREIKNVFSGLVGSAQRSATESGNNNYNEFSYMLMIFLLKAGLYFCLKEAYRKGFDFANL